MLQQMRNDIDTIAFGDGREVEHHTLFLHRDDVVLQFDILHTDKLHQTVYLLFCGHLLMLEAKAPRIDQWSHRNVEGTMGVVGNLTGQFEYVFEVIAQFWLLTSVNLCYNRLAVEHREFVVDFSQFFFYFVLKVFVILIDDAIGCSEYQTGILLIGSRMLLSDDEYRSDNEQSEEGQLP